MDLSGFRFFQAFTSHCALCGMHGQASLCRACKADLPWIHSACRGCGLPLPTAADRLHCGECLENPSPFQQVIAPFSYAPPLRQWITGFKHHNRLLSGQVLGALLLETLQEHYLDTPLPELILPVPLHWQRLLWRGYNQSVELGKSLSQALGIPCRQDLLKRQRKTPSQQGLNRPQRLRNLQQAFAVSGTLPCTRVALLDDVITTGATAQAIAQVLQAHGASEIHLWAIARTPHRS